MTEKKKRIRPTLTQVRALEGEILNRDNTIKQLQYQLSEHKEANNKLNLVYQETKAKLSAFENKMSELHALEQSNKLMEQELERLRESYKKLYEYNEKNLSRLYYLENRGFWARLFNL